jgi:DNA-binding GntR family transcriptional regulator
VIPHRGAYVPAIPGREVAELLELRGLLGSYATQLAIAAQRVPASQMQETLDLQGAMPDHADPESARSFIRMGILFHQQLIDAATLRVCRAPEIMDALVAGDVIQTQKAVDEYLAVARNLPLRT